MTSARSFVLARWLVAALVVCTALLTVSGIAAQYFDLGPKWNSIIRMCCAASFAGIAVFALATSQVAASMAQTLSKSDGHKLAFRMAVACTLVTGAISVGGAHMGAVALGLDPLLVDIGGFLLAFVKPSMSYVSEACAEIAREADLKEKHREQDGEWALRKHAIERTAPPRAEAPANDTPAPKPTRFANQRAAARRMSNALAKSAPKERRFEGERVYTRPSTMPPPLTAEEVRLACAEIARRAETQRSAGHQAEVISINTVARELGVNRMRLQRRRDLHPVLDEADFAAYRAA